MARFLRSSALRRCSWLLYHHDRPLRPCAQVCRGCRRQPTPARQLDDDCAAGYIDSAGTGIPRRVGGSGSGAGCRARLVWGPGRGGAGDLGSSESLSDLGVPARRVDLAYRLGHCTAPAPRYLGRSAQRRRSRRGLGINSLRMLRLKGGVSERRKGKEGEAHLHWDADAPHLVDEKDVVAAHDAQHAQSHCSYQHPPAPSL